MDATRRTRLANERTYLAWWRSGLTAFAVSIGAGKLIPAVSSGPSWPFEALGGAFGVVFGNPQSILCGVISGLLFIPTTIFDMTWGVRYLQEAHTLDYASAVLHSAIVPVIRKERGSTGPSVAPIRT